MIDLSLYCVETGIELCAAQINIWNLLLCIYCLGSTFAVSSFLKPGAGMRAIVDTVKEDIMKLKSDDVVIW